MSKILAATIAVLAAVCSFITHSAQAAIITTQGTWYGTDGTDGTLLGRDINGNPVNLLDAAGTAPNPDMVFVYDTHLDLTWLADWNAAAGTMYDDDDDPPDSTNTTDGRMTWGSAIAWADALVIGIYDDWRLPWILDTGTPGCNFKYPGTTDCGYNVQTADAAAIYSPLAHMFYTTLANLAQCPPDQSDPFCRGSGSPQPNWGLTNTGPFTDMQPLSYWADTVYAPDQTLAWDFATYDGRQSYIAKHVPRLAVAVRPGDVFVSSAPEPASLALVALGLAGLAAARRRRSRQG